ncbi:MAG: PilW family protein [Candidatus Muiribacteriota bacterium]
MKFFRKHAFTFVEVMVAVGISTFVLFAVFGFYMMSHRYFFRGTQRSQLVSDLRGVVNLMTEEITRINEIEEMTHDMIRFRMHALGSEDITGYGRENFSNITYYLDRREGQLIRIEGHSERVILEVDKINVKNNEDVPLFTPFIKDREENFAEVYSPDYTDTERQDRIIYIRIRLLAYMGEEEIDLITGSRLEFQHNQLLQPDWSF